MAWKRFYAKKNFEKFQWKIKSQILDLAKFEKCVIVKISKIKKTKCLGRIEGVLQSAAFRSKSDFDGQTDEQNREEWRTDRGAKEGKWIQGSLILS